MNFMGPHTNLNERLNKDLTPKPNSIPRNTSDFNSMIHDIEYKNAKDNYLKNPTPENRKQQLRNAWKAGDIFINEMNNDNEEPMAKVAGKPIQTTNSWNKIIYLIQRVLKDSVLRKIKILILP